jgi:DNA-directed RNA polymerase subunit RPC12/RpoP
MKKWTLASGVAMTLVGGYLFTMSMIMINDITIEFDWTAWTIYLTLGAILVSVGPGVIVWAFVSRYRSMYNQTQWQMVLLPVECPECGHSIEIHSLEWIGPNEARCPFCSHEIDVRTRIS